MPDVLLSRKLVSTQVMAPSESTLRARARREARWAEKELEIEWFIDEVSNVIEVAMEKRVRMATEFTKTMCVKNISKPVVKARRKYRETWGTEEGKVRKKTRTKTVVVERSKPGEFPRADTTQLMKTLFAAYRNVPGKGIFGFIGTPLDYGLILEVSMDRSFLLRTVLEQVVNIRGILTGPVPGGGQSTW